MSANLLLGYLNYKVTSYCDSCKYSHVCGFAFKASLVAKRQQSVSFAIPLTPVCFKYPVSRRYAVCSFHFGH
jgi:hypothetical protein